MMSVTFTPKQGGSAFAVRNVQSVSYGVSRPADRNGRLGSAAHEIHEIVISRLKSVETSEGPQLEDETVKLSAAKAGKAYFKGEILISRANDPEAILQTLRWEEGHITSLSCSAMENQINETITVSVTDLQVDDFSFTRVIA